jgi:DNA modification methylase
MLELNKIYNMDCLEGLKQLDDNSINCCVTSPPYWGLRDYGVEGQIGLEKTPEEYVSKMVEIFREVKRVLRKDGTLWLNLGDCYSGNCSRTSTGRAGLGNPREGVFAKKGKGIKPKDLVGIPWMVAFALRADGWYLRQDIIWHKPNPLPESVTDRCTRAHEYIFLLSKSKKYYYDADAIREPLSVHRARQAGQKVEPGNDIVRRREQIEHARQRGSGGHFDGHKWFMNPLGRNKRSVWTIPTKPFKEAHFAVFPPDLIKPCILAGCPKDGIVLDPFMGSGTTAVVAAMYQRNFIGFELNPEYCKMAEKRIEPYLMQQTIFELLKGGQP